MTTLINGQLQIDHEKGIIHFNEDHYGHCKLRIARIGPIKYPLGERMIDITITVDSDNGLRAIVRK